MTDWYSKLPNMRSIEYATSRVVQKNITILFRCFGSYVASSSELNYIFFKEVLMPTVENTRFRLSEEEEKSSSKLSTKET